MRTRTRTRTRAYHRTSTRPTLIATARRTSAIGLPSVCEPADRQTEMLQTGRQNGRRRPESIRPWRAAFVRLSCARARQKPHPRNAESGDQAAPDSTAVAQGPWSRNRRSSRRKDANPAFNPHRIRREGKKFSMNPVAHPAFKGTNPAGAPSIQRRHRPRSPERTAG